MPIEHRWIDDPQQLDEFCANIRDGDVVAVDTESDHFFAYRPYVALIQVATVDEALLVDPLALDADALDPLLAMIEDPAVIKIMHSARNDISELDRDWGIEANNIFDTQLAARFLGYEKFSLNALLQETAGIKLDKKYQRFDWARRPIPAPARDYAVEDVIHLFDLRDRLLGELETEGWLEAFQEHSEYAVEQSRYEANEFDPENWRKLKGSKDLDGPGRAVCAALYTYRHELCDELDRAPLHIFENSALVRVARDRPQTLAALEKTKGLRKQTIRRNGEDIVAVINDARDAEPPPIKRPRTGERGRRQTPQEKQREKALLQLRHTLAESTGLPVDFVASRTAIGDIAQLNPTSVDDLSAVVPLLNWQRELFGERLVAGSKLA